MGKLLGEGVTIVDMKLQHFPSIPDMSRKGAESQDQARVDGGKGEEAAAEETVKDYCESHQGEGA